MYTPLCTTGTAPASARDPAPYRVGRAAARLIDRAALCPGWAQPALLPIDEARARRVAAELLPLGENVLALLAIPGRRRDGTGALANRIGWLILMAATLQLADTRQALADERAAHARDLLRLVVAEVLTDGRARL